MEKTMDWYAGIWPDWKPLFKDSPAWNVYEEPAKACNMPYVSIAAGITKSFDP